MSESPPPAIPPADVTGLGSKEKEAPAFEDFQASGGPGAAEKRQLCESAFMFGSARPLEFGIVRFAAKVAGVGAAGGAYALGPAVCLVNHGFEPQIKIRPSGSISVPQPPLSESG